MNPAPSSAHWNVAPAPASGDRNVKVAVVPGLAAGGPPMIWVSGVRVSTVHA